MQSGLAGVLLTLGALTASGGLAGELAVDLTHHDNIALGQRAEDIRRDSALQLTASAGPQLQLGDRGALTATATLGAATYQRYDGLAHLSAGVTLSFQHKLGLGRAVPRLDVTASATRLDYRSALRDGWLYAAELGASQRLGDRASLRAAYRVERRTADHAPRFAFNPAISGAVFDLESRGLALDVDFACVPEVVVALGYGLRDGDVVSTTHRNLQIYTASSAIAADPVFGADTFAYRLHARSQSLRAGVTRLLGEAVSLTLAYDRQLSHGEGGNDYRANQVRLTYLYGF